MRKPLLVAVLLVSLTACAADPALRFTFPPAADDSSGTLVISLSRPVDQLKITVNGQLITPTAESSAEVVVERVPAGTAQVVVAGGDAFSASLQAEREVLIQPRQTTTLLLAAPEVKDGAWIYLGLEYLGLCLMYVAALSLL